MLMNVNKTAYFHTKSHKEYHMKHDMQHTTRSIMQHNDSVYIMGRIGIRYG